MNNMKLNHYFEINVGKKGARNVKFSNNGQLVITNCGDKKIRCYQFSDLGQNKKPKPIVLESTLGNPGGLDLSPCGNYLIAGDEEGEIEIWNLKSNTLKKKLKFGSRYIYEILFSFENKNIVALHAYKFFLIFDIEEEKNILKLEEHIAAYAFMPNNILFISKGSSGELLKIDLNTGEIVETIKDIEFATAISISSDFKFMSFLIGPDDDFECYFGVWDIDNKNLLCKISETELNQKNTEFEFGDDYFQTCFSPDDKIIATSSDSGQIGIWDWGKSKLLSKYETEEMVEVLDFSPDGKFLAITGQDSPVTILEIT